jgi:hypothetical protein
MGRGVGVWIAGAILVLSSGTTVLAAQQLSEEELRAEMRENRTLAAYVERNGLPDVAEAHFLSDRPPWDDHEVTLYYLNRRLEIGFARALVLGRPDVQISRYERQMTDAQVAAIAARPKMTSSSASSATRVANLGPDARAEDAARRAEAAAGRVEAAVAPVERAADRAEAIASRMEQGRLKK